MELDWVTPQQAAERWNITDRRVQALCANGQVKGAVRLGRGWLIPKDTPKPIDGRTKTAQKTLSQLNERIQQSFSESTNGVSSNGD